MSSDSYFLFINVSEVVDLVTRVEEYMMTSPVRTAIKGDVIPHLVIFTHLFMETRQRTIITIISFAIIATHMTLLGFVQLLVNINIDYWLSHFLTTFGSLIMIVSYVTLLTKWQDYFSNAAIFFPQFWPLNKDPSNYAVLEKHGTRVKLHFFSAIVTLTAVAACLVPMNEYNNQHISAHNLFLDHLGRKWASVAAVPLCLSLFHAAYAIEACAALITYVVVHLKFQLFFVSARLVKMQKVDGWREDHLMGDRMYQSKIRRELVACVDHYCLLKRLIDKLNAVIFYPILGFVSCGVVVLLGIVAILKYAAFLDSGLAMLPVCVACAGGVIAGSFCIYGQLLEDESEKVFHSIANLPWYLWNTENRKIVMMLLVATEKRFSLSSAGIIHLNHRLAITLYRLGYSGAMLLLRI